VLIDVRHDARDCARAIVSLLARGPEQGVRAPVLAGECPLTERPFHKESHVADQGKPKQSAQQQGERVHVVLVTMDEIDPRAAGPVCQPQGVPRRRERPSPARPWHAIGRVGNGVVSTAKTRNPPGAGQSPIHAPPPADLARASSEVCATYFPSSDYGEEQDVHC